MFGGTAFVSERKLKTSNFSNKQKRVWNGWKKEPYVL